MESFKDVVYNEQLLRDRHEAYLAADIGGTNSNFGLFVLDNARPVLLVSLHCKSQEIERFTDLMCRVVAYVKKQYGISVFKAVIAAAGAIVKNRTYTKPTNLDITIDTHEIMRETDLQEVLLANDFEIIGYGLDLIDPDDIITIHAGDPEPKANKAIVGAGTGLGKCILLWHQESQRYIPVASEGGHADFAAQYQQDFELLYYGERRKGYPCPISWENVLSGKGIQLLYSFFRAKNSHQEAHQELVENGLHPDEIFNNRTLDEHSANTFSAYAQYYARCAKCFALDALALGGIYIAGGIAAKNVPLFKQAVFLDEFFSCNKQQGLLKRVPIYVISDYNVSLYGAAEYMRITHLSHHN